jgi:two-component system, NtrC family, nitrogen regulation sensor histidine kinase NtrY
MVYKNFRLNVIIRVLLLTATLFLLLWVFEADKYYVTPVLIVILAFIQVFSLIYYVDKTNRDVTSFLESIRFSDFTRSFQIEGLGSSFDGLKRAFNDVIKDFQKIRSEKEEHYFYLQTIIQHIEISILAYSKDGTVEMINNSAKKMFQLSNLKNIRALASWSEEMEQTLRSIRPGQSKLVKVQDKDDILQLSIFATEFKINDRDITLVSIKNIQTELEEQEMEAWQKLIRVLTHEIMNSIAPIASLTSTVNLMIKEITANVAVVCPDKFDFEMIEDIHSALETIHKRSTGLIHFVETYRNLTKIPKPNFTIYTVKKQFEYIRNLLDNELKQNNIELVESIEPELLEITADEQLIEQVLINLIKNSIHALENTQDKKKIQLKAYQNKRDKIIFQVIDNGQGIIKEVIDKIFIPFFTTKSTGSGIGLSLSKQIMRLHGGTINVISEPDVETCFTLTF